MAHPSPLDSVAMPHPSPSDPITFLLFDPDTMAGSYGTGTVTFGPLQLLGQIVSDLLFMSASACIAAVLFTLLLATTRKSTSDAIFPIRSNPELPILGAGIVLALWSFRYILASSVRSTFGAVLDRVIHRVGAMPLLKLLHSVLGGLATISESVKEIRWLRILDPARDLIAQSPWLPIVTAILLMVIAWEAVRSIVPPRRTFPTHNHAGHRNSSRRAIASALLGLIAIAAYHRFMSPGAKTDRDNLVKLNFGASKFAEAARSAAVSQVRSYLPELDNLQHSLLESLCHFENSREDVVLAYQDVWNLHVKGELDSLKTGTSKVQSERMSSRGPPVNAEVSALIGAQEECRRTKEKYEYNMYEFMHYFGVARLKLFPIAGPGPKPITPKMSEAIKRAMESANKKITHIDTSVWDSELEEMMAMIRDTTLNADEYDKDTAQLTYHTQVQIVWTSIDMLARVTMRVNKQNDVGAGCFDRETKHMLNILEETQKSDEEVDKGTDRRQWAARALQEIRVPRFEEGEHNECRDGMAQMLDGLAVKQKEREE